MQLAVWKSWRRQRPSPRALITLTEAASDVDREAGTTTLHFRLDAKGAARLEALRDTRSAMIREEWTLGLDEGEPSLAEAIFSAHGVLWEIPIGDQGRCREKLRTLVARTNRRLESGTR